MNTWSNKDYLVYHITANGILFLGFDSGGITSYGRETDEAIGGQHWVNVVYPSARCIDDFDEFSDIVNKRCEQYMQRHKEWRVQHGFSADIWE
jgi:hypothetical protein